MLLERIHLLYAGRVQGVGFRYTAISIARRHPVTGWVKNLPDGRVELIAEGETKTLEAFLSEIRAEMGRNIETETADRSAATGEFRGFRISR